MKIALIVGAGVVGLLLLLLIIPRVVQKYLKGPLAEEVAKRYAAEDILLQDLKANSFGVQSDGGKQLRGNGALVLSAQELYFIRALPRAEYVVPLDKIIAVEIVKVHAGKAVPYDLLRVEYRTDAGEDAMAWWVEEPEAWKQRIEGLVGD